MRLSATGKQTVCILDDLGGLDAGILDGTQRRYYCTFHGGDHQRSLSIADSGDRVGLGYCHNCKISLIVTDYPGRPAYNGTPHVATKPLSLLAQARKRLETIAPAPISLDDYFTKELAILHNLSDRMLYRVKDDRPCTYLVNRGIDLAIATLAQVGYIPDTSIPNLSNKWRDRIIFPLWHPDGLGYFGRSLVGDSKQKTARAGWYGVPANDVADTVIVVEGPFDRLALLAAGADAHEVIALVGTAFTYEWLPRHVKRVILAFDNDAAGHKASEKYAPILRLAGIKTVIATPSDDLGKDPSEQYQRGGCAGLSYIFDAWDTVMVSVARPVPIVAPLPIIAPPLPVTPPPQSPAHRMATVSTNCYTCNPTRVMFTRHDVVGDVGTCQVCKGTREIVPLSPPIADTIPSHEVPPDAPCTHCGLTIGYHWLPGFKPTINTVGVWSCNSCRQIHYPY